MSILIKNMEMPKRGETITVTICDDGLVFEEYYKGVFNAVPIPPHGDLIDRDDFFATCPELVDGYKRITDNLVVIPTDEDE